MMAGGFKIFVHLIVLAPALALGAETDSSLPKLAQKDLLFLQEETVSIASQYEQPISESPSNVYVITDEDIRHSGATDIPTILRRIPGMEVMQMTGADFNVSVRGNNQAAANRLLVLVDGRAIYEYIFGSVFWTLLPVTLPEIQRIEVWKGPASAVYGFNAFDGVVNIITKTPNQMKGNTNGSYFQFGGGEFGTIRSTAIQAGTFGDFGYRLSFGHDQNQKWGNRDALALRSNKFNIQTEYGITNTGKVVLSGGLVDSNRFDGQVFDIFRESSKITNGYVSLNYESLGGFIRGSWTRFDEKRKEFLEPPDLNSFAAVTDPQGSITQDIEHNVFNIWAQHGLQLTSTNKLVYGAQYLYNATSSNILRKFTRENRLGIYFHDEWKINDLLTFLGGVRGDLHNELNPKYSPRLALLFRPHKDHTFRISGSVAHRPPNALETRSRVLTVIPSFSAVTTQLGSQNLDAEQIISYEVGYQGWYFNHRIRIRADGFYNHISDIIFPTGTSNPTIVTFTNGGAVDIYGGEVGFEFLITPWLTLFGSYATAQVHETSDLDAAGSIFTRGAAPWKVNAGLRGEWDNGLNAEALVHHLAAHSQGISSGFAFFSTAFGAGGVPDTRVKSYTLVNLRGGYRFWKDRAEASFAIFNALNDKHRENPVGEIIRSRVMGWLTLKY